MVALPKTSIQMKQQPLHKLTRQWKSYLEGSNPGYLFLICSLLKDAAGSSDYAGSDDWVIEHNEL